MDIRDSIQTGIDNCIDLTLSVCESTVECVKWLTHSVACVVVTPIFGLCDFIEDRWEDYQESASALSQREVTVATNTLSKNETRLETKPKVSPSYRREPSKQAAGLILQDILRHLKNGNITQDQAAALIETDSFRFHVPKSKPLRPAVELIRQDILQHRQNGRINLVDAVRLLDTNTGVLRRAYPIHRNNPDSRSQPAHSSQQSSTSRMTDSPVFKLL